MYTSSTTLSLVKGITPQLRRTTQACGLEIKPSFQQTTKKASANSGALAFFFA
jgi:hypothetical protein